MSSGTFESARVFPQQQFSDRFETRSIKGGSSPSSFDVSEVDNGKFLNISLNTGPVTLVFPPVRTAVGVRISGAVVATNNDTAELFFVGVNNSSELLGSFCLSLGPLSVVATFNGTSMVVANVKAGSTFTAWCTGSRWVLEVVASSHIPS